MKILVIGDIFAKAGRKAVKKGIELLKKEGGFDLIIANGENLAHGKGMTRETFREMREAGVDVFTTGNHILAKPDIFDEMKAKDTRILRPANFPEGNIGIGHRVFTIKKKKVLIINLIGQVFMPNHYDSPFHTIDKILKEYKKTKLDAILVDFHAEVTSEKIALKHYLDGRVTALWGTHTHVPTADAEVTEKGMAYITDVGMTGPINSVIGVKTENIIESFLKQVKFKMEPGEGACIFNALVIEMRGSKKAVKTELRQIRID